MKREKTRCKVEFQYKHGIYRAVLYDVDRSKHVLAMMFWEEPNIPPALEACFEALVRGILELQAEKARYKVESFKQELKE